MQEKQTDKQLFKSLAKQIYESPDQVSEGLKVQQLIKEKNYNSVKTNDHFVGIRREMKALGMTADQANKLLYRTEEMIQEAIKQQIIAQNKKTEVGLPRIDHFNFKALRKRVDSIDFKQPPTLDNIVDVMLVFCQRNNEYNTLKLHIQPDKKTYKISGFSKTKDNTQQRDFVSIYPPSKVKHLVKVLNWIQSHTALIEKLVGYEHQLLNNYLQKKYQITASLLRKYGTDAILQYKKPKNPSSYQLLICQATRHIQRPSADCAYGTVNTN